MIIKYQGYWASRKQVKNESHSVSKWDTWSKTKYEKKVEEGNLTSKEVAHTHHSNKGAYEVCIFENENSVYPDVSIDMMVKSYFAKIHFIDPAGRDYLSYSFAKSIKKDEQLFLQEIWFREYANEDTDTMKSRTHFVFDEDGNVNYRVYDMIQKKTLDYESKEPFDVSGLYEPYPEFGKYEGIIKLERDIPMLDDVIS